MTILQSYTTQMVLLGTALLGLASGIAGTFAVLRKESLIGDGLSHAALPGVVIAFLLTGIKDIEVLIIGAALSSITAAWLITITVENNNVLKDMLPAIVIDFFCRYSRRSVSQLCSDLIGADIILVVFIVPSNLDTSHD